MFKHAEFSSLNSSRGMMPLCPRGSYPGKVSSPMTPRFRLTCTAILAGMVLPMLVVADAADPRAWLDRMSHSFRELNYSGVFTYEFGQQMSSIRIVHAVVDGVERERIVHLDGPMVEVIRTGHELSCIHVGDSLVRLDHTIPAGPFAKQFGAGLGPIEDHYQVVLAGDTRVAGRDALVLEVRPLDAFRFGYQLAVDKATALLLRSQLLDAQHRILERFQFAELRIGGAPDLDGLEPSTGGQVVAPPPEWQRARAGAIVWISASVDGCLVTRRIYGGGQ